MTTGAGTVGALVADTEGRLAAAGVESPRVDAELLVGHVLALSRTAVSAAGLRSVSIAERDAVAELAGRRARREPLQHILGEWGFRRLTLTVDGRALIPRPETEVVVERVLALLAGREAPAVLDVGTGSGAIALAVADEHPGARVLAIDRSEAALALAGENVTRCGLDVQLEQRDLFDGLPAGPWDVVVSNPPYVPLADREALAPEVRDWEPAEALFGPPAGPPAGRDATEAVARGAIEVLAEGGALVLEVGDGQAGAVVSLLGRARVRGRARDPGSLRARARGGRKTVSSVVAAAAAALEADEVVVLPTDTVYGLVATAYRPAGRDAVYRLKGRDYRQPTALMAASLDVLFECVPELRGRSGEMAAALLPGPYTLVLPNPAGRLPWLCGDDATSIGVRVPDLVGPGGRVLTAVGAVVATSANLPGGPEPRSVEEVPEALRAAVAVVVDGGELPGVPSTVLDLTGTEPRVVRAGAGDVPSALARLSALV